MCQHLKYACNADSRAHVLVQARPLVGSTSQPWRQSCRPTTRLIRFCTPYLTPPRLSTWQDHWLLSSSTFLLRYTRQDACPTACTRVFTHTSCTSCRSKSKYLVLKKSCSCGSSWNASPSTSTLPVASCLKIWTGWLALEALLALNPDSNSFTPFSVSEFTRCSSPNITHQRW